MLLNKTKSVPQLFTHLALQRLAEIVCKLIFRFTLLGLTVRGLILTKLKACIFLEISAVVEFGKMAHFINLQFTFDQENLAKQIHQVT